MQIAQRRVSRSEIVKAKLDAETAESLHQRDGKLAVLHDMTLGDLEFERLWIKPRIKERRYNAIRKIGLHELLA